MNESSLIQVKNLTLKFADKVALNNISWEVKKGINQVLCGPNGSGKTLLSNFISKKLKTHDNSTTYLPGFDPDKEIEIVSFEFQQELFTIDDYNDDTDFLDYQDIGTTAKEIILHGTDNVEALKTVSELLEINYILDKGIRFLSTGEMRKVMLARAMMNAPKLIIIDSPFEGLDQKSLVSKKETH